MGHTRADDERPVLFEATVRTPLAPMHAENRIASPMVSQQLAGHRVQVLDEDGDWVEAHVHPAVVAASRRAFR